MLIGGGISFCHRDVTYYNGILKNSTFTSPRLHIDYNTVYSALYEFMSICTVDCLLTYLFNDS